MAWITSNSVSVSNGSKTVSVSGNVDLSSVDEGWGVQIGENKLVEASSGTAPNGSGVSTLTLFEPWPNGSVSAATMKIIPNSGYQIALAKRIKSIVDRTVDVMQLQHDYASQLGQVTATDPETNEQHVYNTLRQNQSEIDALLESFGTAAGYDVTESATDTGNGANELPKLLKVGDSGINTTVKKYVKVINIIESSSRELGRLSINARSAAQVKVTVIGRSGAGIGNQLSITNTYSIQRVDGAPVFHELISIGHNSVSGASPNILNPNIDGGDVVFGLASGNNGTGSTYNYTCIVEVLSNSGIAGFVLADDGAAFTAASTYPRGLRYEGKSILHTGNMVGTVSQSSSVPTGAIIERGSNANGEYTKFADGTMICTRTEILTSGIPITLDEKLSIDTAFQTPVAFSSAPTIQLTATAYTSGSGGNARKAMSAWIRDQATSIATGPHYYFTRYGVLMRLEERQFNQPNTVFLFFTAIGRWY